MHLRGDARRPDNRRRVLPALLPGLLTAVLLSLAAGCGFGGGDEPGGDAAPSLTPLPLTPAPATSPRSGDPSKQAETGPPANVAPALARFYDQKVSWETCRTDKQCATMVVPLDYRRPEKTITLSLLRVRSTAPDQRIGSLVVNPGGPGGSGVGFAAGAATSFGPELRRAFDIVGFDPRGVGESTPVRCLPTSEIDEYVASDPDPDTAAEIRQVKRLLADFGAGCVERSGALAGHVSTREAAQDMDILRSVLGDRALTYYGASYGTFLGATYADLFPGNVGRMVLDGAIDPSLSNVERSLVQAKGFETALRAYVGRCVDEGSCFLGPSVDAGTERIKRLLDEVDREPLPGSGGRMVTQGHAVLGVWAPLYNPVNWPVLDAALKAAFAGDGSVLLSLSDFYTSRGAEGYEDNSVEALYAVNCLDHDDAIPASDVAAYVPRFEKASPTFGSVFAFGLSGCGQWPVSSGAQPGPLVAKGSAPIVVVGTTRDPATPLAWAEALTRQLDNAVLIRRDGDGHTGYNAGNRCVDDAVDRYLVAGRVPKGEVDC